MKLILSRKGFDSSFGGCASPILPDGTMLSMPIPGNGPLSFDQIQYRDISGDILWKQLAPKRYDPRSRCHLDPDIRAEWWLSLPHGWEPSFGQCDAAQSHLQNQGVGIGDIFLFFGWFRRVEYSAGRFHFVQSAPDVQAIYGYLQIGEILSGNAIRERFPWHPHADAAFQNIKNNTLYVPTRELCLDGQRMGLPGSGTLCYNEKRVLTAPGQGRRYWKLPDWMQSVKISYHSPECFHNGYFESRCRGQEFVVEDSSNNTDWVQQLLCD